jgi:hypothetical protein
MGRETDVSMALCSEELVPWTISMLSSLELEVDK